MYRNNRKAIIQRTLRLAKLVRDTHITVQAAADIVGTSKSTAHRDLRERLPIFCADGEEGFSMQLLKDVSSIIDENKAERSTKGGQATRIKYVKDKA